MQIFFSLLTIAGFYPLFIAWRAQRRTSLLHAVLWAGAAWMTWGLALIFGNPRNLGLDPWRYLALCLTGAAGVAVLGARRPRLGAWNLVVLGLLAVMLLPLGENFVLGTWPMDGPRLFFLAATLAVGILNYVPTTFVIPALLVGVVCVGECLALFATGLEIAQAELDVLHLGLLVIPWMGLASWRRSRADRLVDRIWLEFRNCYGLLWGQRVRDQYNRGAANARLPGYLYWHGWEQGEKVIPPTEGQWHEMQAILAALLKRFGNEPQESERC